MVTRLTLQLRDQMNEVNRVVNTDTTYITDMEQYGVVEKWEYPKGKGDCEDIALAKIKELLDKRWPKEDLNIAICMVNGVGHAVCIVDTTDGTFVLDNIDPEVQHWENVKYEWVERSVKGNFNTWATIG